MKLIPCALLLLIVFAVSSAAAPAEDFCAVTLSVLGPDHAPVTSTWIELDDPSGNVVRRQMMMGPTLKISDFGFGPHTLRVGTNECLPVAISNLRLVVGSPVKLDVVLSACAYREKMRSACLLYFRVVDEEGHAIPDVDFAPRIGMNQLPKTDSYGRYQTLFGGALDITFSKQGFAPETLSLRCSGTEEIDKRVTMKQAPGHP
jgi:hypothetical protein